MIEFLNSCDLTTDAQDGTMGLIFGQLPPNEAISFNNYLKNLSEVELMLIVLRNIKRSIGQ